MQSRHKPLALAIATFALATTACASTPAATPSAPPHGYVEGAAELPEPQLHLATVAATGEIGLLDLLDGTTTELGQARDARGLSTDGRYAFVSSDTAVTVVDTGVWMVDHEDHVHYYRADPRVVGEVEVASEATVTSSTTYTALTASGEAIILDSQEFGEGRIEEVTRFDADVVLPYGDVLLTARGDVVQALDADGEPLTEQQRCVAPEGTIVTRVGAVIGCADGALLATETDGEIAFEAIPYPDAALERATEFRNRAGRPTVAAVAGSSVAGEGVAAVAGEHGAWLLDTRERLWTPVATDVPLLQVSAADDSDAHVVALAADGSLLVIDGETGATITRTAPLLADPAATGIELTVDASRAYLNDPAAGVVYEIDYADGARIARELAVESADFLAVTGR